MRLPVNPFEQFPLCLCKKDPFTLLFPIHFDLPPFSQLYHWGGGHRKEVRLMPEKEKIQEVQTMVDNLHALPEAIQQRVLGMVEGFELARKTTETTESKEDKGA